MNRGPLSSIYIISFLGPMYVCSPYIHRKVLTQPMIGLCRFKESPYDSYRECKLEGNDRDTVWEQTWMSIRTYDREHYYHFDVITEWRWEELSCNSNTGPLIQNLGKEMLQPLKLQALSRYSHSRALTTSARNVSQYPRTSDLVPIRALALLLSRSHALYPVVSRVRVHYNIVKRLILYISRRILTINLMKLKRKENCMAICHLQGYP